jgi:hypothetical protein
MVRAPCCRGAARERGARARHGQHDDDDDPPQPWL